MNIINIIQEEYNNLSIEGILSDKYNVILDIYEKPDYLILSRIIIPKEERNKGIGTSVMNDIIDYANKNKKDIFLTPSGDFGGNKNRLIEFYKNLGFVFNKGKNRDYRSTELMVKKMKINNIIKEQFNNIIKENIEYKNIDFDKINNVDEFIQILESNLLNNLINLSKIVVNLPKESRSDLSSIKDIIEFLENINKDIIIAKEIYDKYEESDFDEDKLDIIDKILHRSQMIYYDLSELFDKLDSINIEIDDKFEEFIYNIKKYIK
jgi:hypothetical protein